MTFRKPLKAVPIRPAPRHRHAATQREAKSRHSWLLVAALTGTVIGTGTVAATPEGRTELVARVKPVAVAFGVMRERAPQDGDHWSGCDDARAAGTAPVYYGEPGYSSKMDGDSDGIACESYR